MTIEELEKAVEGLSAEKLAKFRAWFEEFDSARFDEKLERDALNGKFDTLGSQALADHKNGRTREL